MSAEKLESVQRSLAVLKSALQSRSATDEFRQGYLISIATLENRESELAWEISNAKNILESELKAATSKDSSLQDGESISQDTLERDELETLARAHLFL